MAGKRHNYGSFGASPGYKIQYVAPGLVKKPIYCVSNVWVAPDNSSGCQVKLNRDLLIQNWSIQKRRNLQIQSKSRPISRVLSWTIIHLGLLSPASSSDLPEDIADHDMAFLFGLAPGGVYHATNCYQLCGALLPHHFTLTCLH